MLLEAALIRTVVREIAEELRDGQERAEILVVGGSMMALRGLRQGTADVDSASRLPPRVLQAARVVGARHGLAPSWLNDAAAAFVPASLSRTACDVVLDHPRLLVLAASAADVFLMKLLAARARDHDDMVALWPETGFSGPADAVRRFHWAYPNEPEDEHLEAFVVSVAERSTA